MLKIFIQNAFISGQPESTKMKRKVEAPHIKQNQVLACIQNVSPIKWCKSDHNCFNLKPQTHVNSKSRVLDGVSFKSRLFNVSSRVKNHHFSKFNFLDD